VDTVISPPTTRGRAHMKIRPCIDLRDGRVVQIVGATLADGENPVTNFDTERPAAEYAALYRAGGLSGGHVIALGPNNEQAALNALRAWPGGMQMGGGIRPENAAQYLEAGASHVIVTSYIFREGQLDWERLQELVVAVGKQRLVLDLSCRWRGDGYYVVTDRWQRFTALQVNARTLEMLAAHCDEFLVHGVDVEGRRLGIVEPLVELLGAHAPLPVTYAGGVRQLADVELVRSLGRDRVDLTIGSALDIFGGSIRYEDVVAWQRRAGAGAGWRGSP
jgi:phosphoribosylformimino-5-aminoimidazole carboxamide ribotide isomerase